MDKKCNYYTISLSDTKSIIFLPNSIDYFIVQNNVLEILSKINSGVAFEELTDQYSISRNWFDKISARLAFQQNSLSWDEKRLSRLVINISNDCNMRCKYCFANHGTYNQSQRLMSDELLIETLNNFYTLFPQIDIIQLFGGEPFLNERAIEICCEYVNKHNYNTRTGVVTNGSLLTQNIIWLIKKYKINITVSIDIELFHDELRPFISDKPSYGLIKKNIQLMQSETNEPSLLEFTYTKVHDSKKITVISILKELKDNFGEIPVHIAPASGCEARYTLEDKSQISDSIHDIFKANRNGERYSLTFINSFLFSLKNRNGNKGFCTAGFATYSVSVNGDIFPCFHFIDNDAFKIANVYDKFDLLKKSILIAKEKYYHFDKSNILKCQNCDARKICRGCLGANFTDTNNAFVCSNSHCEFVKKSLHNILYEIGCTELAQY